MGKKEEKIIAVGSLYKSPITTFSCKCNKCGRTIYFHDAHKVKGIDEFLCPFCIEINEDSEIRFTKEAEKLFGLSEKELAEIFKHLLPCQNSSETCSQQNRDFYHLDMFSNSIIQKVPFYISNSHFFPQLSLLHYSRGYNKHTPKGIFLRKHYFNWIVLLQIQNHFRKFPFQFIQFFEVFYWEVRRKFLLFGEFSKSVIYL